MARVKPAPGRVARNWQPPADETALDELRHAVLALIRDSDEQLGCTEIARKLNTNMDRVYRALDRLLGERRIEKVHTKLATRYGSRVRYRIKADGIAKVEGAK